jgi:hypothetical protein
MTKRDEPEVPVGIRRALGSARASNARIGRQIAQLEGRPTPTPQVNEFEEKIDTAVKRLEAQAQAVVNAAREKLPSTPGDIHVHVDIPTRPDNRHPRTSPPPSAGSVDIRLPLLGSVKARGTRSVLAVVLVAGLLGLAWMAGTRFSRPAPAGGQAPASSH